MRITDKDKLIYKHIADKGFATVKQIGSIFFNDIIYRNELAKKRLNALIEHGYIKKSKSVNCNQDVYYEDKKFKGQSYHNIIVLDLYSKFAECRSVNVLEFKREKSWGNHKIFSDGFLIAKYTKGDDITVIQHFIIEVHQSNNSWIKTLEKYQDQELYDEIVLACGGFEPVVLFIDDMKHDMTRANCPFQVVQIDARLTDFPLIFDTN